MKKIDTNNYLDQSLDLKFVKDKEDFVRLINQLRMKHSSRNVKPIPLSRFTFFANPELSANRYETFEIAKKNGEKRKIHAPKMSYKAILSGLDLFFRQHYKTHPNVMGFAGGKSILHNAKPHVRKKIVLNIDLKDFFHSFERKHVKWAMVNAPFYLNGEREPLAFFIACLCTHPMEIDGKIKFVLPQGSPCSPVLTNLLCRKLDKDLKNLAKEYRAAYTRYADDITFSSNHHSLEEKEFIEKVESIITKHGLKINSKKIRLQKDGYKKEVTGIIVNEKTNLPRKYIKQLRMWLYYWEKYGYEKAEHLLQKDYLRERAHKIQGKPHLMSVMDGKLQFLKMVKGQDDPTFKKLENRFHKLNGGKKLTKAYLELVKASQKNTSPKKEENFDQIMLQFHKDVQLILKKQIKTS